jgi:FAD/FMN-containing dehydrogenase
VYWRLVALDRRFGVADRLEARHGRPPRERVVQDVELPIASTAEFLRWFLREVPIEPVWLCPLRLLADEPWTLYPLRPRETYVNVGFWSTVPSDPARGPGATNRRIEREVTALGGHKSLYSESFYGEEEFARLYDGAAYAVLKERWDPGSRLPHLYDKAVRGA